MLIGTAVFMGSLAGVGAVGMWPIYRDPWFLLVAATAIIASIALASVAIRRRWRVVRIAIAYTLAALALGVPLAVPSILSDPVRIPAAFVSLVRTPVTGPADLLTLALPLGTYQATLAPAFLTLLIAPGLAVLLGVSTARWWPVAALPALAPAVFAVAFGATTNSVVILVGTAVTGLREAAVGIVSLIGITIWMLWRSVLERRAALREIPSPRSRAGARATAGRVALGAGMLSIAVLLAAVITPWATSVQARTVPRSQSAPVLEIREAPSPLSAYRTFLAGDAYERLLFTVTTAGPERVRLATLSFYDGRLARVLDPAGATVAAASAFTRVPSLTGLGPLGAVRAEVEIADYDQLWVPTVDAVTAVSFTGPARAALTDGFFYNLDTATGINLSDAFGPGVQYTISADAVTAPSLREATPPRNEPTLGEGIVPASVTAWIRLQDAGGSGAGLAELIDRLRARGYLSHAWEQGPQTRAWEAALGEYAFAPSRAGHSTDRIDALFTTLVERQNADPDAADDALVAGVGDDEQFAVAAAMIADQLGFPARIVLGARLSAGDASGIPPCENGQCRGKNMTAWIEVQDVSGLWIPVDVTPQSAVAPAADLDQRRDPLNITEVEPERAEAVEPPEAEPAAADPGSRDTPEAAADLSAVWAIARIAGGTGVILLVLLGPLLAIVAWKALRRRRRRSLADQAARIAGGWDEWVDTAIDHGSTPDASRTRSETALAIGAPGALALAAAADRASFADTAPTSADADEFWLLVDQQRAQLDEGMGRWARWRAAISLRSLRRRP